MAFFNKKLSNQTLGTSDFQEEAQESVGFQASPNVDPAKDMPVDFGGHTSETTTPKAGDKRAADGSPHADCPLQKVSRTERGELEKTYHKNRRLLTMSQVPRFQEPASIVEQITDDQQAQQAEQAATEELTTEQRCSNDSSSEAATLRFPFFSLPPELRQEIYTYLIPDRIHISLPRSPWHETSYIRPWSPVVLSKEFRHEMRKIAYSNTPITIYLCNDTCINGFKTWCRGLPREISLRHINIDNYVDIDWITDGSVLERSPKVAAYDGLIYHYPSRLPLKFPGSFKFRGDWVILWLVFDLEDYDNDIEGLYSALKEVVRKNTDAGTLVTGLDRNDVRYLANVSYLANRKYHDPRYEKENYMVSSDSEGECEEEPDQDLADQASTPAQDEVASG
ncbi:MAG: hypothetical protein Q9198_000427 [Flavoplaca austrocitrina]